jgi:hypothetical protein
MLRSKKEGTNEEYIIASLSLMPADKVEGVNLCAMAKIAGCEGPLFGVGGPWSYANCY